MHFFLHFLRSGWPNLTFSSFLVTQGRLSLWILDIGYTAHLQLYLLSLCTFSDQEFTTILKIWQSKLRTGRTRVSAVSAGFRFCPKCGCFNSGPQNNLLRSSRLWKLAVFVLAQVWRPPGIKLLRHLCGLLSQSGSERRPSRLLYFHQVRNFFSQIRAILESCYVNGACSQFQRRREYFTPHNVRSVICCLFSTCSYEPTLTTTLLLKTVVRCNDRRLNEK